MQKSFSESSKIAQTQEDEEEMGENQTVLKAFPKMMPTIPTTMSEFLHMAAAVMSDATLQACCLSAVTIERGALQSNCSVSLYMYHQDLGPTFMPLAVSSNEVPLESGPAPNLRVRMSM